jgi:hypothetical protein
MILTEQKNTHMEHVEDMIFNDGVDGARMAINSLRNMRDMLAGKSDSKVNATVKWDGAPAIFAGIDPEDGQFFVAKKGLFNVNPKLYKTQADIDRDLSGELKTKFTIALKEFSKLGISKGVFQGDLLFTTGDVSITTIDGEKYYSFQPNTIVYTVPVRSSLGAQVARSKIGVVWHTTYTGSTIKDMKASFGQRIVPKLKKSPSIFMDDASYRDVSGNAKMTQDETAQVTELLSQAGKIFNTIRGDALRAIRDNDELKQKIKTYNNTYVRKGVPFPNVQQHVSGLYRYIEEWYQKEIDKKKTPAAKQKWQKQRDDIIKTVFANARDLKAIFMLMNKLIEAKQLVINKMNRASNIGTFLRTANGFKATTPEGFVAIDRDGNAVKLVDRLEFSRANFSPEFLKGWQK